MFYSREEEEGGVGEGEGAGAGQNIRLQPKNPGSGNPGEKFVFFSSSFQSPFELTSRPNRLSPRSPPPPPTPTRGLQD